MTPARFAKTRGVSIAVALLLWAPAGLRAQESATPDAVAREKEAKELEVLRKPQGVLEAASLGKLLQLPDWLDLSASWTAEPMGNTQGGATRTTGYIDQLDLEVSISSGLSKKVEDQQEWDRWLSLIHI